MAQHLKLCFTAYLGTTYTKCDLTIHGTEGLANSVDLASFTCSGPADFQVEFDSETLQQFSQTLKGGAHTTVNFVDQSITSIDGDFPAAYFGAPLVHIKRAALYLSLHIQDL